MKRFDDLEFIPRDKAKNWIYQLEQEGIEKGIEKVKNKTIKNLIKEECSTEFICDVAEVSSEYVAQIRKSME